MYEISDAASTSLKLLYVQLCVGMGVIGFYCFALAFFLPKLRGTQSSHVIKEHSIGYIIKDAG